jgi:hypothetical protein
MKLLMSLSASLSRLCKYSLTRRDFPVPAVPTSIAYLWLRDSRSRTCVIRHVSDEETLTAVNGVASALPPISSGTYSGTCVFQSTCFPVV